MIHPPYLSFSHSLNKVHSPYTAAAKTPTPTAAPTTAASENLFGKYCHLVK